MSGTIEDVYLASPTTDIASSDLLYVGKGGTTDAAISGQSFANIIQYSKFILALDEGTVPDDYFVTLNPAPQDVSRGLSLIFFANNDSTARNPNITVNGMGQFSIANTNGPLAYQDIVAGTPAYLIAEGAGFTLINPGSMSFYPFISNNNMVVGDSSSVPNDYIAVNPFFSDFTGEQGSIVYLLTGHTNTGPSTFTLGIGGSPVQIVQNDGVSDITAGQMVNGTTSLLVMNRGATKWQLINPAT